MEQNEKNIQKDQELTKEELEQVNGGGFLPRPKGVVYWIWLTVLFVIPNLVYTLLFLFLHRLSVYCLIPTSVDTLALFLRWLSGAKIDIYFGLCKLIPVFL